jgi:hypothetical protein
VLVSAGTVTQDFAMQASQGAESEQRSAGGEASVDVADPVRTDSVWRLQLENLPVARRDPLSLMIYQPGVQLIGGDERNSPTNGSRQAANSITMDGVSVGNAQNPRLGVPAFEIGPDVLEAIRIVTAGAKAEYGQGSGSHVTLTSRHGGNRWSGELFDYFSTKAMNATGFFHNSSSGGNYPVFSQNIYGGSFSGPLWKERTFTFLSYEGRRTDQAVSTNQVVLTSAAKAGIFQWYRPGTKTLQSFDIAGNDPRKLGIDRTVAALLAKLPDPNNTDIGDGLNTSGYRYNAPADNQYDRVTMRLDHALTSHHRLFSRFSLDKSRAVDVQNGGQAPYPGGPEDTIGGRNWAVVAGSDWTPGSRVVSELRFGHTYSKLDVQRPGRAQSAMVIPNTYVAPAGSSFPRTDSFPVDEVSETITAAHGRHVLKAGASYRRTLLDSTDFSGSYPDVTLGRYFGNLPLSSIGPSSTSAISAADRQKFENFYNDLLGRVESVSGTSYSNLQQFLPAGSPRTRSYSLQDYAAFVQDDWKLSKNFTLNFGVRYELSSVPRERNNLQGVLDQASLVTTSAHLSGLTVVPSDSWYRRDPNNWGPRVGFAWDMSGRGKTVLRGSYGLFYDRLAGAATSFVDQNTVGYSQLMTAYPNVLGTDVRLSDGIANLTPSGAPVVKLPATRSATEAIFDPALRTGYVHQFSMGLQKQITPNTLIEAAYVGSRGTKLFTGVDLNQTRIEGDFLQAFNQLHSFRQNGTPIPASNTLVRIFGSAAGAISAIGGSNIDLNLVGTAADAVDRTYYSKYAAAGVTDSYLRNFPQFNQFLWGTNAGRSWYDSAQFSIRRTSGPLTLRANYTWSKAFDTVSTDGTSFSLPLDSFNPAIKAPSDTDRRHIFNALGVYEIPIGSARRFDSSSSKFVDWVLGNWNLGMLAVWESGAPFSVSSGRATAQAGSYSLADYSDSHAIGAVQRQKDGVDWFTNAQIALFSFPSAGGRGSSGRNSFVGPGYFNLDASMVKRYRIGEQRNVLFRVDVFNVMNTVSFALPGANLSDSSTFGKLLSQQGRPRFVQVALRFQF